jgi:hypothetical protein
MVLKDLVGQKFGRLMVIEQAGRTSYGRVLWKCLCDCGVYKEIAANNLTSGTSKSCGCLNHDAIIQRNTTHGMTSTAEYKTWRSMLQRCSDPNSNSYCRYGARGITVCDEWKDFRRFISDMGERPSNLHSIGRINNDAGYSKDNCAWETRFEQSRNKRNNRRYEYKGKKYILADLITLSGLNRATFTDRIDSGWSIEAAVETPARKFKTSRDSWQETSPK